MSKYAIDPDACRGRQQRLIEVMRREDFDCVIVTQAAHVQWLTGAHVPWLFQSTAVLDARGKLTVAGPSKPEISGTLDEYIPYDAKWHSTLRNDQRQAASSALLEHLGNSLAGKRIGVEYSSFDQHLAHAVDATFVDVEPELYYLRRRKDADELARIRQAISATERMYARAREIIQPGITEIEVFNELQATAVSEFGEPLTGTGNDYQCGSRGGPPRHARAAAAGELYILDLGPAFRGYFADNARTIAVSTPNEIQLEAWTYIIKAFEHIEATVRPGKSAKALFGEVQDILDTAPVGVFNHHLGHGIGLFPHEAPHLNPHWDDTFEEGDVFTAEPGLYASELQVGMRIENDYLVTATGVELLTPFSLEL